MHKCHAKGWKHNTWKREVSYNKDYYALETFKKAQTLDLLNKIPIRHPEKIAKRELIFDIYRRDIVHWNTIEKEVKKLRFQIKQSVLLKLDLLNLDLRHL